MLHLNVTTTSQSWHKVPFIQLRPIVSARGPTLLFIGLHALRARLQQPYDTRCPLCLLPRQVLRWMPFMLTWGAPFSALVRPCPIPRRQPKNDWFASSSRQIMELLHARRLLRVRERNGIASSWCVSSSRVGCVFSLMPAHGGPFALKFGRWLPFWIAGRPCLITRLISCWK